MGPDLRSRGNGLMAKSVAYLPKNVGWFAAKTLDKVLQL
jgi:hypothetical protein